MKRFTWHFKGVNAQREISQRPSRMSYALFGPLSSPLAIKVTSFYRCTHASTLIVSGVGVWGVSERTTKKW